LIVVRLEPRFQGGGYLSKRVCGGLVVFIGAAIKFDEPMREALRKEFGLPRELAPKMNLLIHFPIETPNT